MVSIEGEKIIIEIQSSSPEELLVSINKGVIAVIQAVQARDVIIEDQTLGGHLFFVLELYKSLQLSEEQFKKGLQI
jgi:hypothetical protein